jgi:hypothetical protein
MTYHIEIRETRERDGTFDAWSCKPLLTINRTRDPEYDMAKALIDAGHPDGPCQFYRDYVPSTSFRSILRASGYKVSLGERFPYALVKRWKPDPEIFKDRCHPNSGTAIS